MNCKQGDMAIVIKSWCGNEGRVVTCEEFAGECGDYQDSDMWRIDINLPTINSLTGDMVESDPYISDSCLMPIGTTETEQAKQLEAVE